MDTFKFVIIGSGNISMTYANAVSKVPGCSIVGVVSRSGSKPEPLKESQDIEVAATLPDLTMDYDGIIITTPNGLHHVHAIEAAKLGKHILTEKVLDISEANMEAMIRECGKNKVKLGVAFQRRMSPDNKLMKKLIDNDKLGRIFAADLCAKFYRDQSYYDSGAYRGTKDIDGGGPFMQQAAHNIDIYCWFFGMPQKVVSALDNFCHRIETEDHGAAILTHDNGMIGTVIASTATYPGFSGKLEIHSEKGTVILENHIITHWSIKGLDNPSQSKNFKVHDGATSAAVEDTSGHVNILKDFIDAVKENREPVASGESARMATDLILKIYSNQMQ